MTLGNVGAAMEDLQSALSLMKNLERNSDSPEIKRIFSSITKAKQDFTSIIRESRSESDRQVLLNVIRTLRQLEHILEDKGYKFNLKYITSYVDDVDFSNVVGDSVPTKRNLNFEHLDFDFDQNSAFCLQ